MYDWRPTIDLGPTVTVGRRPAGRRLLAFFLTDLTASVAMALVVGWLIQASTSDDYLHDAMAVQNDIYVSISRFAPHNLATSYLTTVGTMNRNQTFSYQRGEAYADAVRGALVTLATVVLNAVRAVPDTILELYRETGGAADSVVLAGLSVAIGSVFVVLLRTRRSPWRLLLATAISPFAISVVFVALQGFMVAMLDMFYWFTALASYTVACPVICTLYWVVFPNAERGATATVAHALLRILDPKR